MDYSYEYDRTLTMEEREELKGRIALQILPLAVRLTNAVTSGNTDLANKLEAAVREYQRLLLLVTDFKYFSTRLRKTVEDGMGEYDHGKSERIGLPLCLFRLLESFERQSPSEQPPHLDLTYEAFLEAIGKKHSDATQCAFEDAHRLYLLGKIQDKAEAVKIYNPFDYGWIDDLHLEGCKNPKRVENTCKTIITEAEARWIIHKWYGFEFSAIKICGPAYYEATDWNMIRFMVCTYPRVLWNDSLYDLYR